jgi:hypothetical protein
LFGEEDDLAGVVLDVAGDFEDGFEDGGVAPGAGGLGVDGDEEAGGVEGGDDAGGVFERGVEVGAGFGGGGGGVEGELIVAAADVGLAVDAVQDPLAEVSGEVEQEIGDGVFVVAGAVPELGFGEAVAAAGRFLFARGAGGWERRRGSLRRRGQASACGDSTAAEGWAGRERALVACGEAVWVRRCGVRRCG